MGRGRDDRTPVYAASTVFVVVAVVVVVILAAAWALWFALR